MTIDTYATVVDERQHHEDVVDDEVRFRETGSIVKNEDALCL